MTTKGSPELRAQWLRGWAQQNPSATVSTARAALKEKFGIAMGTEYIAATLRAAREASGFTRKLAPPKFAEGSAASAESVILGFVQQMRGMGFNVELRMSGPAAYGIGIEDANRKVRYQIDATKEVAVAVQVPTTL